MNKNISAIIIEVIVQVSTIWYYVLMIQGCKIKVNRMFFWMAYDKSCERIKTSLKKNHYYGGDYDNNFKGILLFHTSIPYGNGRN